MRLERHLAERDGAVAVLVEHRDDVRLERRRPGDLLLLLLRAAIAASTIAAMARTAAIVAAVVVVVPTPTTAARGARTAAAAPVGAGEVDLLEQQPELGVRHDARARLVELVEETTVGARQLHLSAR